MLSWLRPGRSSTRLISPPPRMSLLPSVSRSWRHTCSGTERLLKAQDKQSRTCGNLTCRHSSRLFNRSSSGVCWIITDSRTCLFKASPPNTPVTFIPKPGAQHYADGEGSYLSWLSLVCVFVDRNLLIYGSWNAYYRHVLSIKWLFFYILGYKLFIFHYYLVVGKHGHFWISFQAKINAQTQHL